MKISRIMTKKVISVKPETPIDEVAQLLSKNRIHGVPVVNNRREVVGIIAEADLFSKSGDLIYLPQYISMLRKVKMSEVDSRKQKKYLEKIKDAKAEDIMTKKAVTINQNSQVGQLIRILRKNQFNLVPVVNDKNKLVGVVSSSDLLRLFNLEQLEKKKIAK